MPLNASQLAERLGVSRAHITQSLKARERAEQEGRTYEGRVPKPTGYQNGKPYWIVP